MADQLLARLETAVARLEKLSGVSASAAATEPQWISDFENQYVTKSLSELLRAAQLTNSSEVVLASELFVQMNKALVDLIRKSQHTPKPATPQEMQQFLLPATTVAQKLAPDNRSDFFANQKAVSEAMSVALVLTTPAPASHLQAVLEAADFHLIKVLKKKIEAETAWAKQLKACMQWMITWASDNIKMGLIWNSKPQAVGKAKAPPPPPAPMPGPAPAPAPAATAPTTEAGGFGDVMKQLGSGNFSLKKTERTRSDAGGAAPMEIEKPTVKRPFVGKKIDARTVLERDCWYVEGHGDNQQKVQLAETNMKQSVYIGKCGNSTVVVTGKVKTITIDGCDTVNLLVDSVISTIEIVNCRKINLQITGSVPSVSVDKTDGVQLFLSEASVSLDLTTAKSSEINVNIPVGDGDWKELVVPEQFVHKIQNNRVVSKVSDLYG